MPLGNPIRKQNESRVVSVLATEGQTVFTVQGGYIINHISVFRNGVRLSNSEDFTAGDGSTVTLNNAANIDDRIEFHIFDRFTVQNAIVSAASTQTINGDLVLNGKLFGGLDVPSVNTGIVTATQLDLNGSLDVSSTSVFNDDVTFTGAAANIKFDQSTDDLIFDDDAKAIFGSSSDLQIYHDGSDSYIKDTGTGDLKIFTSNFDLRNTAGTETLIDAFENGAVKLYWDNALRLETSEKGIKIGAGVTIETNGNIDAIGIITATTFVGNLTGTASANAVLTGSTNNQLVTVTGANAITGESNLTYDGNALSQTIDANDEGINITASGAHSARFKVDTNQTGADDTIFFQSARWNSTEVASIHFRTGADTTNKDDGRLTFHTRPSGGSMAERLRILSSGSIGIGTATTSDRLHVFHATDNFIGRFESGDLGSGIVLEDPTHTTSIVSNNGDFTINVDNGGAVTGENIIFEMSSSEKMRIDSTGYIKLSGRNVQGSSDGDKLLRIYQPSRTDAEEDILLLQSYNTSSANSIIIGGGDSGFNAATDISFRTAAVNTTSGTERLRINSGGKILIGHTSARGIGGSQFRQLQIEGTGAGPSSASLVRNSADASPPSLNFGKSRSSSVGGTTIVQDGDNLGLIGFAGADGTDLQTNAAEIRGEVDGTPGANDMPGRLVFHTTADDANSSTERLRIDSNGRVIITNDGVTNPTGTNTQYAPLVVRGNTSATSSRAGWLTLARSEASANVGSGEGIGEIYFGDQQAGEYGAIKCFADAAAAVGDYPGRLSFWTTADGASSLTERLRIDSYGRVLVSDSNAVTGGFGTHTWDPKTQILETQGAAIVRVQNGDTWGGSLHLASANGTYASPTATASGDISGAVYFHANDGTDFKNYVAGIEAIVADTVATNDTPGYLKFSTTADGANTLTERVRIDSSGNLLVNLTTARGIGGTSNRRIQVEATDQTAGISIVRCSNNATPPTLDLGKARGSSVGSNTIVQDDDKLGLISFSGADGDSVNTTGVQLIGEVDGTPGDNDMPGRFIIKTRVAGGALNERMRITQDGKIGIADQDPQEILHINNGASSTIMLGNTTHGYKLRANVTGSNDYGFLIEDEDGVDLYNVRSSTGTADANTHRFYTAGTERLKIGSDGALTVTANGNVFTSGTTALNTTFTAAYGGAGAVCAVRVTMNTSANDGLQLQQNGSGTSIAGGNHATSIFNREDARMRLGTDNTEQFRIEANGNLKANDTTIASLSDSRLKKNIVDFTYDLTKFKNLKPRIFDWINPELHGNKSNVRGFIAQEIETVDSTLVGEYELFDEGLTDKNPDLEIIVADDGTNVAKDAKLGTNDAMYISVIQQLITKIETLETKVSALEGS